MTDKIGSGASPAPLSGKPSEHEDNQDDQAEAVAFAEKAVATAFLVSWEECSTRNPTTAQLERQLKVLASVGRLTLDLWEREFGFYADVSGATPAKWLPRRRAFFSGRGPERLTTEGAGIFETYRSLMARRDSHTQIIVARTEHLERETRILAEQGVARTEIVRERVDAQMEALQKALPDSDAAILKTEVEGLKSEVGSLRRKLVRPEMPGRPRVTVARDAALFLGGETLKAALGLLGLFLLLALADALHSSVGGLFRDASDRAHNEVHDIFRPKPGATERPKCDPGFVFEPAQGSCVAPPT